MCISPPPPQKIPAPQPFRLTFLVYLNDGFSGGSTTFYTPAGSAAGGDGGGGGGGACCLEARSVAPRAGNILVFPHGDTMGGWVRSGCDQGCGQGECVCSVNEAAA